jgi:hypothetical protein
MNEPAKAKRDIRPPPAALLPLPVKAGARDETQPCPRCGYPMPALKGGSASICANCGFKDSCCY